ncbi:hypothetical protein FDECE_7335 [Fusarium decemcellulare]|nr:hypothetical protein FDECE_7335 [Fusarium decemcellulare]
MPPRASSVRRSTRFSSREPEQATTSNSPNALVRPQLPPLQGTPSSRRQYTYGSGVEPPPRPMGGLQRMDLNTAVNEALSRRDDAGVFVRPPKPQQASETGAESNQVSRGNTQRGTVAAGPSNAPGQAIAGSDADSSRSFGMESDYYEDATIGSALAPTPAPQTRQAISKSTTQNQRYAPEERDSQPPRLQNRLTSASTRSSQSRVDQQTGARRANLAWRQDSYESEEEEQEEDRRERRNTQVAHEKKTNTPAPDRMRRTKSTQLRPQKPPAQEQQDEESEESEDFDDEQGTAGDARRARVTGNQRLQRQPDRPSQNKDFFTKRRTGQSTAANGGLFAQAKDINKRITSLDKVNEIADDPHERDLAIQQEIREAEEQIARERAEREERAQIRAGQETWKQILMQLLARVLSMWPFRWVRALFENHQPNDFDDFDEDEHNRDGPVEWWRLLHPMTYMRALQWLCETITDHAVDFLNKISGLRIPRRSQAAATVGWFALGAFGLIIGTLWAKSPSFGPGLPGFPSMGSMPSTGVHLPSPSGLVGRLGSIIPTVSWPSWGQDEEDLGIWEDEGNPVGFETFLKTYEKAIGSLKKDGKLHNAAIKKLEAIVPRVVHTELVNGRPVIAQDFWHALRDLLKEDGTFFSFDKHNGEYDVASHRQWQAMVARLTKDPSFTSKLNKSVAGAYEDLEKKLPNFWDAWVKNNQDKIEAILDKVSDKRQSAGSGHEFDERLSHIVNEQLKSKNQAILSRDEFIKRLEKDLATHRAEILAELKELKTQMEEHVLTSIRTATMRAPDSVSKAEITSLVKGIVNKALADASLEATAEGKIYSNWDTVLRNHVNYFGIGAGATIDARRTDPTWDPWNRGIAPEEALQKGIAGLNPNPPIAALRPWSEEGDCWCAARSVNHRNNTYSAAISVQLGHLVVPEHVVIEHILPKMTTDGNARPKHIEVWASFEDPEERARVRDYAFTHIPDDNGAWDFEAPNYGPSFVKISQFMYESVNLHNGVHIHGLARGLIDMNVPTDHVIIRSVSNYGASTHTCFYRVRLLGKGREGEEEMIS